MSQAPDVIAGAYVYLPIVILSDRDIRSYVGNAIIEVKPEPVDRAYQPASLEVHLAEEVFLGAEGDDRVLGNSNMASFKLSHTVETIRLPKHLCAQVNGKSSLGRLGLLVHATAGFIDPGFEGQITLELKNLSSKPLLLAAGQPIAQLVFHRLTSPPQRPYGHPQLGSHYQGQVGTTRSYMDRSADCGS